MTEHTHNIEAITVYMTEHNLSTQDVLLILQRHTEDKAFEEELNAFYEGSEWGNWSEGDLV